MTDKKIRVILIDDHDMVRAGMVRILQDEPDIEVVGSASEGLAGLQLLERYNGATGKQPGIDVLVTDIGLPDISGLDLARRAKARFTNLRILIVSMYSDDKYIQGMMEVGIDGYLVKQASTQELAAAVRAVAQGEMSVSPIITRRMVAQFRERRERDYFADLLTEREREVLELLAQGATSKELARRLELSVKTVENHRAHILEKLGATNIAAAIRVAAQHDLLAPLFKEVI